MADGPAGLNNIKKNIELSSHVYKYVASIRPAGPCSARYLLRFVSHHPEAPPCYVDEIDENDNSVIFLFRQDVHSNQTKTYNFTP